MNALNIHVISDMSIVVTREYLISLLEAWQENKISANSIYETASNLFSSKLIVIDEEGKEDNSVTREVLAYLECLDMDFITQDDIEPCKEFLKTPIGQFDEGLKKWQNYIATINHEERVKKLQGQAPYI